MKLSKSHGAAILLGSAAFIALATPAMARPGHHHHYRHSAAQAAVAQSYASAGSSEPVSGEATQSQAYRRAQSHANSAFGGFTSDALVNEARKYIGTNPTGRGSLWCGAFMDLVLKRTGHAGGGNLASAYARYGTRVSGPQVGAIAVMGRRGGGHVGVVSGIDANGNPIVISGNHNHTTAESVYPRGRIYAYVMP
jgi:uncharacterized protein (TIGR02594 family)